MDYEYLKRRTGYSPRRTDLRLGYLEKHGIISGEGVRDHSDLELLAGLLSFLKMLESGSRLSPRSSTAELAELLHRYAASLEQDENGPEESDATSLKIEVGKLRVSRISLRVKRRPKHREESSG